MRIFKQKFTAILLVLTFLIGAISTVNFAIKTEAASQTVGDLTINYPSSPLFNASNIAPGYEEVKTISVKNNGNVDHSFSLSLDSTSGGLANVIHFEPRTLLGDVIWNHTLAEIAVSSDGFVVLPKISPGQTATFKLAAILPATVGNEYQNKSASTFGIIMGSDSSFPYNPPVIPIFGDTGSSTGSGQTSATGSSGRQARYLAATDDNPTTINDIPETPSNQTGEVLGATAIAKGESAGGRMACYWWLILLIIYAAALVIYGWIFYTRELIFDWIWPIFGGVVLYIVHLILHRYYEPSKWCPYFIWVEILLLIIYFIIYSRYKNKPEGEPKDQT